MSQAARVLILAPAHPARGAEGAHAPSGPEGVEGAGGRGCKAPSCCHRRKRPWSRLDQTGLRAPWGPPRRWGAGNPLGYFAL